MLNFSLVTAFIKLLHEWSSSLLDFPQKSLNVDEFLVKNLTDLQRYWLAWCGCPTEAFRQSDSGDRSFTAKLFRYLKSLLNDPQTNFLKKLIKLYLMANTCQVLTEMMILRKFGHDARMKLLTYAEFFK